jgi:hypothetical protein
MTKNEQLQKRIEDNKRGAHVTAARAAQLLAEYLDEANPTSYRKLAAKHGLGVGTVQRAIKRAAGGT